MERRRLLVAALHDHAVAGRRRGRGRASSRCRSARGRARASARVTGAGKTLGELAVASCRVTSRTSSSRRPRATVPGTSGRDARPSAKNVLASSGSYFGWSCMSCRQPGDEQRERAPSASDAAVAIGARHQCSTSDTLRGSRRSRKRRVSVAVELRIGRPRCRGRSGRASREREARHVEDRVVRHRQPVQREHAEHRRERGASRTVHLEGDRDERRPAVERPAADVERVVDRPRSSTASAEAADAAGDAAEQHEQRQPAVVDVQRLRRPPRSGTACRRPSSDSRPRAPCGSPRPARSGCRTRPSGRRAARFMRRSCARAPPRPRPRAPACASRRSRSSAGSG